MLTFENTGTLKSETYRGRGSVNIQEQELSSMTNGLLVLPQNSQTHASAQVLTLRDENDSQVRILSED